MSSAEDINKDSSKSNTIISSSSASQDASGRQPASAAAAAAQLASAKIALGNALRQFPDFPIPGIAFVDIMPLFANPNTHKILLSALELQIAHSFGDAKPDVIVGLDARGFLFGPTLAARLGVGFVAVRKKGKLPGPCVTAEYLKEYGSDWFQMQQDAVKPGQKVLIVDDIIATGGSTRAAAELVGLLEGQVIGCLFILAVPGLNGQEKLGGIPTAILLDS